MNYESATTDEHLNLAGQVTITKVPPVLQSVANSQLLEAAWQENLLHMLVELIVKSQCHECCHTLQNQ